VIGEISDRSFSARCVPADGLIDLTQSLQSPNQSVTRPSVACLF
jgi:hypothetical protein